MATYLPFDNHTNIALGMASSQLVALGLKKFVSIYDWVRLFMGRKSRYIQISVNQKGKLNPIYKKIEDYIIETKIENLRLCNIVLSALQGS